LPFVLSAGLLLPFPFRESLKFVVQTGGEETRKGWQGGRGKTRLLKSVLDRLNHLESLMFKMFRPPPVPAPLQAKPEMSVQAIQYLLKAVISLFSDVLCR